MCSGLQHPHSSWGSLPGVCACGAAHRAGSGADPAGNPKPHGCSCPRSLTGQLVASTHKVEQPRRGQNLPPAPPAPWPFPAVLPSARGELFSCHEPRFAKLLKGKRWEPAPRPRPPEPCPKEPGDERVPLFAGGGGKPKIAARPNSRKAKSPAPGLSSGERPPSVSSVHSEGDCNRRTPLTNRVWEDRPSSAGRTRGDSSQSGRATSQGLGRLQGDGGAATAGADSLFAPPAGSTPFPYNPLTMRLPSGVVTATPSAPLPQGTPGSQHHAWDEEPKPLLCSQYETLSDSE